jgi:hypothetical protein
MEQTRLLVDPDIDATAKKAVSRQVGELESERERLQQRVAELADDANDNTARLATGLPPRCCRLCAKTLVRRRW